MTQRDLFGHTPQPPGRTMTKRRLFAFDTEPTAVASVFSRGLCVGFIMGRDDHPCVEAYSAHDLRVPLGFYDTRREAANAVLNAAREP